MSNKFTNKVKAIVVVSTLLVLSLVLLLTTSARSTEAQVSEDSGVQITLSESVVDKLFGLLNPNTAPIEEPTLGALAGPDIPSPWLKWGGFTTFHSKQAMQTATTTLCAIQNPKSSTTTLQSFTAQVTSGTSTAAFISLATSTSQYATVTVNELITDHSVPANNQTTVTYNGSNNVIGPSEYVLFQTAGAGLGGYTYTGTCQATFEAIAE